MASAARQPTTAQLIIDAPGQKSSRIRLEDDHYRLGRAPLNELCFAEDGGLSREHLVFELLDGQWTVMDLQSRNGTTVNGMRLTSRLRLVSGDTIHVGHLSICYMSDPAPAVPRNTVVFVDQPETLGAQQTGSVDLKSALAASDEKSPAPLESPHLRALVRAGRELVGHRPLEELFQLIIDLSVDAVKGLRGVLMTLEGDDLTLRAHRGEGFRISTSVRDRILTEKTSILIRDTRLDEQFAQSESLIIQRIRSVIAAPLQTEERVIGLIYIDSPYLDSPVQARGFTPEDLNLLTILANVAAIRIEHARLIEVEKAKMLLARDIEQAAEIQRRLLPAAPPSVAGFDVAGYNAACRTVGGDYYDYLCYPDGRIALLIGDVAGKGMPAALLMSSLHARVQVLFEQPDDLASRVARLNRSVTASCPGNRFITFFAAVLDPVTGEMCFCNAGHNPPLLLRANDQVETLDATGSVLGIFPDLQYEQKCCRLDSGDTLILFSDGVTESCDPKLDLEFGEDGLLSAVRKHRNQSSAGIIGAIDAELCLFTAGAPPADDITLVVVRRLGSITGTLPLFTG